MVVAIQDRISPTRLQVRPNFIDIEWPLRRFAIEEYHRMGEIIRFPSEEHFELINGLLIWNTDRTDMSKVQKGALLKTRLPLRRFSLDEFQCLIESDLFTEDERLELIDGLVLEMSPINPRHAGCLDMFLASFSDCLGKRAMLRIQSPITLEITVSQPYPDLALVALRRMGYFDRHPTVAEVLLIVEVADSTLEDDRDRKLALYAKAGIREYWIANLIDRLLEVYRDPFVTEEGKGMYRTKLIFTASEKTAPLAFPNCEIDLSQVFPPQEVVSHD